MNLYCLLSFYNVAKNFLNQKFPCCISLNPSKMKVLPLVASNNSQKIQAKICTCMSSSSIRPSCHSSQERNLHMHICAILVVELFISSVVCHIYAQQLRCSVTIVIFHLKHNILFPKLDKNQLVSPTLIPYVLLEFSCIFVPFFNLNNFIMKKYGLFHFNILSLIAFFGRFERTS